MKTLLTAVVSFVVSYLLGGSIQAQKIEAPPQSVFPYTDAHSKLLPPRYLAPGLIGIVPIPTNAWWGNLIGSMPDPVIPPVWTNPYAQRVINTVSPYGLSVSYPYTTRSLGGTSGNGNASQYYIHSVVNDLTFSASQFTRAPKFEVFAWDMLSVSIRFTPNATNTMTNVTATTNTTATSATNSTSNATANATTSSAANMTIGKLESILTSGMATMTFKYTALTPRIITSSNLVTVNGQRVNASAQISNNRFLLALGNGQKWVLYTSGKITLRGSNTPTGLLANASFTGYIRAAIYTSDAHLAVLDKTKACLLGGGEVKSINTNSYAFNFKTSGVCTSGLFHYLHIHHLDTLDQSSASVVTVADLISSTRGKMTGVLTKTTPPMVQFTETASVPADFYPPRKPNATIVAANNITQTLINDINASWSIPVYGSYYFNGKAAQKYAQLCLLAKDSSVAGVNGTALLRKCLDKLEAILLPYVENKWSYPMKYDTVYRGIVSSLGFAYNDPYADFGNTMYNDHHYHWGYWIMTAAIVNYLDPTWSRLAQMNRLTSFLIRDVANPTSNDKSFAKFRYFDWFRGHSFSHGVTPSWDGKDQESTSEEINFHYGMTLFGKVTKNAELTAIGQLMLKLNTRSIQTYFLMQNNNRAHPAGVIPNKVIGIFFDNKIDYMTWFSSEKYAIHGIQMIPITPVTEFVRTRTFVQEEWSQVLSKMPIVVKSDMTNGWLSLLYANYATVNSTAALQQLQKVALDDGLSRSWALYIAATRP